MIGSNKKEDSLLSEGILFLFSITRFIFLYIPILWWVLRFSFVTGLAKKRYKILYTLYLFFQKSWRYPLFKFIKILSTIFSKLLLKITFYYDAPSRLLSKKVILSITTSVLYILLPCSSS